MVIGSAIGPGITGLFIDLGVDFPDQALWMTVATVLISVLHIWVMLRLPRRNFDEAVQSAG